MINNDVANHLNRYFNRPGKSGDANGSVADMVKKRMQQRQQAITGKPAEEQEDAAAAAATPPKQGLIGKGVLRKARKDADAAQPDAKENKNGKNAGKTAEEEELSPMERRERELKAIMDKLNAEEAQRYPTRYQKKDATTETAKTDGAAAEAGEEKEGSGGLEGFLNDMPLFNEFKSGLMDAFKRLDSAAVGAISAQYELNYSTMQYVANEAGEFEYKETSVNIKLDLNYVKAAAGGKTGKEIADAIGKSDDFASLVENLQNVAQNQQGGGVPGLPTGTSPEDFLTSMQDYFSPEKTADRIVDFSSAFFGKSDAFKKYGDTEEGRAEFAKTMRDAIQKGFDQAMGTLGAVPKSVKDGIDKTHELTFKGIDDFVKNGYNRNKQDQGVYSSLEQFAMNFQVSYSSKSVSYSKTSSNAASTANNAAAEKQATPAETHRQRNPYRRDDDKAGTTGVNAQA